MGTIETLELPCKSIVRIWSGMVPQEKADSYEEFLKERAIPDYLSVMGNLGVIILRKDDEKNHEIHYNNLLG